MIKYVCDICGEDATHSVKIYYGDIDYHTDASLIDESFDSKHGHLCEKHFEELVNNLKGEG